MRDKAVELLGAGVSQEATAAALGVSPSYISQLMTEAEFSKQVVELRFKQLQHHTQRDNKYDTIEDKLLTKMEQSVPLMLRPSEILRALQVVNAAKRRGTQAQELPAGQHAQVVLNMPVRLVQHFTTNILNQVTEVEGEAMITIQPQQLLKQIGATDATTQTITATQQQQHTTAI